MRTALLFTSLSNQLHELHPPLAIYLRPHGERNLHSPRQLIALVPHAPEYGDVLAPGSKRFLYVELELASVLAHVLQGLCDGFRACVRDAAVPARALFGLGDVPGKS